MYLRFLSINPHTAIAQSIFRNSLLIGLLIGDLLALNFYILLILAIFIALTFMVTTALEALFARQNLPTLSLPFCIVALIIFILLPNIYKFSQVPSIFWKLDITGFLPNFVVYFFHSIASIFCSTNPSIGLLLWIGIAIASPISALFLWMGYALGNQVESLFHPVIHELYFYGEGFNYALVFVAIAGFFMVPSRFSILLAIVATIITAVIVAISDSILRPWHLPVLSIPFNFTILATLLSLRICRPFVLNSKFFESPEQNIETSYSLWNRHRFPEIGIFLPVEGSWKIQQAFNGDLTHRGTWQHALDFVAVNESGEIFSDKGLELADHFAFEKDVISPIEGFVVAAVSGDADNIIGHVVNGRNWGNYLIIKSSYGFYVTLAHLKKDSLLVVVGDFVKVGQRLAQCGNSGYSQEPHLHLQVQYSPEIGAATAPFHLMNYISCNKVHFHRVPLKDEIVQSLNFNYTVDKTLNFKVDEKMVFKCNDETQITITSQVDEVTGCFYLTDGIAKMYHTKIAAQFYFYELKTKEKSPLCDLMIAAPRIPITYGEGLEYYDELPPMLTQNALCRFYCHLKQMLGLKLKNSTSKYLINKYGLEILGTHKISSKIVESAFRIDPMTGIQEFEVGDRKYVRVTEF